MQAWSECMYGAMLVKVDPLIEDAENYAADGKLDPLTGLKDSRIYVYHGTNDWTIGQGYKTCLLEI